MGYDRAIVVFSPEGRMYQVEYARKAVEKASTVVGVTFSNGVVLVAARSIQKLLVPESIEKISKVDDHIGIASCGILADSRVLVDYCWWQAWMVDLTCMRQTLLEQCVNGELMLLAEAAKTHVRY